ncbi:hypothetical protein VTO73DRAFT_1694 [Trametes versicolor]
MIVCAGDPITDAPPANPIRPRPALLSPPPPPSSSEPPPPAFVFSTFFLAFLPPSTLASAALHPPHDAGPDAGVPTAHPGRSASKPNSRHPPEPLIWGPLSSGDCIHPARHVGGSRGSTASSFRRLFR